MASLHFFALCLLFLCHGFPNSLAASILARQGGSPHPSATEEALSWPSQSFKSSPLRPPSMNITKRGKTEPGYLFLGPRNTELGDDSAVIVSDGGQLIWQSPSENVLAFQPQIYEGNPVLTYWNGSLNEGFGWGAISVLDSSYEEIYQVTLGGNETFVTVADVDFPSYIDLHENFITDEDTILVTAVNVTQADLSSVGGPKDGWIQDGLFYEIDRKSVV